MKNLTTLLQTQFNKMCATGKLFRSEISGRQVWDVYLKAFITDDNPIFRDPESTVHNCNHCNSFIRRYGNIVAIDEHFELITIFDVICEEEYQNSLNEMSKLLKSSKIENVFFETFNDLNSLPYESCNMSQESYKLGTDKNVKRYTKEEAMLYGVVKPNEIKTFHHFSLQLNKEFVKNTRKSIESIMADYRSVNDVFERGMREISLDTLKLVRDLIIQGSLLNGDAHLSKIETFTTFKTFYDKLAEDQKLNWVWQTSYNLSIAKFRNELIGVLCVELSEGKEINEACRTWNKRVDPANYMKAKAPITANQIKMAEAFVVSHGYVESFNRRFAIIDDIKVNEILHSNIGDNKIKTISLFDNVKTTSSRHKRNEFKGIEEVSINKFMSDILPTCSSVEVYLENKHEGNLVSLTTSNDETAKQIFKWNNVYSWTNKGNLAGKSEIKEAVKLAGGKIDGCLNARLAWNSEGGNDSSDLDIWCKEPNGRKIGYSSTKSPQGRLDVDNTNPHGKLAVENITHSNIEKMQEGVYKYWINQYSARNSQGFKAEIEFDGNIFEYSYNHAVSGNVQFAEVTLKNGEFSIRHILPSTTSSKEIYGLETKEFHKVNLMCLSPNHWDENNIGNKHYFFMLEGCKADSSIRSFHSENLIPELAQHRKVLEVLGTTNMLETVDAKEQLSGISFNATVRGEVILKLSGTFKRIIKVKF